MLINNRFSHDDDDTRLERLTLVSANIDDHSAELSVIADRLDWAQNAESAWLAAMSNATTEDGQMDASYQQLHNAVTAAHDYFVQSRDYLTALIMEHPESSKIMHAYGFEGRTPRNCEGLRKAIDAWKDEHERRVAEGLSPVVPDAVMTTLMNHDTALHDLRDTSKTEEEESDTAYRIKAETFATDSRELSILFTVAKLTWGPDSSKLKLLGFVPSSEIWTKNKPPYPKNFAYDENSAQFTWDAVEGVDNYEIDYRSTGASGDWTQLYKGAATSTSDKPPDAGEYDFRIRSWSGDDSGAWSGVISVNFSGGALAAPKNLAFAPKKKELSWESVPNADKYEVEVYDEQSTVLVFSGETDKEKIEVENIAEQKEYTARVRAVKLGSPAEYSPWSESIPVYLGVPMVPQNLRWHPAEYMGDTFALIEWDAAAGAEEYQLIYKNSGDEVYHGPLTHDYDDIMSTPGEHRYIVRAHNTSGWSAESDVLTIVIA